jgi:hypothetical protein
MERMVRPRLNDWIGTSARATPSAPALRDQGLLLSTLRSYAPGQWSQNVGELARHFTSAAFLAVNTLARHAMDSSFALYERTDDPEAPNGEVQLPWHDPACQLFEETNPIDDFADLMYQSVQQLSLTGLDLTWSVPSGRDEPGELYNLPTANCWPMPPSPEYPHGAYRVLPYPFGMLSMPPTGTISAGALIPAEQVVRVKNHHPYLRFDGYAVMTAISQQIDTLTSIDQSRNATMHQGCEQTMAMENTMPNAMDPDEETIKRNRLQLEILYAGPKNAGKLFQVPVGYTMKQISTTPADMAWQEGWSQVLDFILAAFGVPKAVAGLQEATSYATLYSSLRAFCLFSLGPVVRQIARTWQKQIVRPAWGPEISLRITPPEFTDESLEEEIVANDLKAGVRTCGEMRKLRKLDHLDEPWTKERAYASYSPVSATGGGDGGKRPGAEGTPREEDPHVDNARPSSKALRLEHLANAFEKAKTNGHAFPIRN